MRMHSRYRLARHYGIIEAETKVALASIERESVIVVMTIMPFFESLYLMPRQVSSPNFSRPKYRRRSQNACIRHRHDASSVVGCRYIKYITLDFRIEAA